MQKIIMVKLMGFSGEKMKMLKIRFWPPSFFLKN
jgi:hypothetical protein